MNTKCQMTKEYSAIDGIQRGRRITYSVSSEENGAVIELISQTGETQCSESCFFPNMPFERAKDIAVMLSENGLESGIWINVLDDMELDFIITE